MEEVVEPVKDLKLRQTGGSVSATLPKDMVERLHPEPGGLVLAVETEKGILLTPYDSNVEQALQIAASAARKHRNVLRELTK
ncbi:MAG TPA: AbrB/MazE/SpoVT family DNA-binding domain-containing protein [Thermoanaerobaculia bacterium]|nr:AbrB/MazE/SpoVT family DNA-binding domain-containing protein [Thermoanaerobaculia bacterium]